MNCIDRHARRSRASSHRTRSMKNKLLGLDDISTMLGDVSLSSEGSRNEHLRVRGIRDSHQRRRLTARRHDKEKAMPEQLLDFTGKVVLVTGGATGIGRATSLAFARQGANVVIGDVDDRAVETVQLIEAAGGTALFVRTDVTVAADVEQLVATTVERFGGLHVAFNN